MHTCKRKCLGDLFSCNCTLVIVQWWLQHGFDGFGRTHQFLEMGSRTHQFLAKFNMNTKKIAFLKSKGGNLYLTKECRTHQLEILTPPLQLHQLVKSSKVTKTSQELIASFVIKHNSDLTKSTGSQFNCANLFVLSEHRCRLLK